MRSLNAKLLVAISLAFVAQPFYVALTRQYVIVPVVVNVNANGLFGS